MRTADIFKLKVIFFVHRSSIERVNVVITEPASVDQNENKQFMIARTIIDSDENNNEQFEYRLVIPFDHILDYTIIEGMICETTERINRLNVKKALRENVLEISSSHVKRRDNARNIKSQVKSRGSSCKEVPMKREEIQVFVKTKLFKAAFNSTNSSINENSKKFDYVDIKKMDQKCQFCGAFNFRAEKTNGSFRICCQHGKVTLPLLNPPDEYYRELLLDELYEAESENLFKYIRSYNSAFAFASIGINLTKVPGRADPSNTFIKVHGQITHRISSLHPIADKPKYGQLYIMDANDALNERKNNPHNKNCLESLLKYFSQMLENINPFVESYQHMYEKELEQEEYARQNKIIYKPVRMYLGRTREGQNAGRYNQPNCSGEIAAVFVEENGMPPDNISTCVYSRHEPNTNCNISYLDQNCDPLSYPLLFPYGEPGWYSTMEHNSDKATEKRKRLTILQYYAYRIAFRNKDDILHNCRKLFQQYIVEAFVKVESNRLKWLKRNQKDLRVDTYTGLMDHINKLATDATVQPGSVYILPSTFMGSERYYLQNYQDAMAMVSKFGKPDYFITFTCNSHWPEILDCLNYGQKPCDRPDIVARVFIIKLEKLLKDLTSEGLFGKALANVYTIELQKRGLPHAHLL